MPLHLIGLGLHNEKDITLNGLEAVKKCSKVYLENYTSLLQCGVSQLEKLYKKKIILADREFVESGKQLLAEAQEKDVALLIIGDPFSATTHVSLFLEAQKMNIPVKVIHNASILHAVSITGLQLYNFGKVASIPFAEKFTTLETPYTVLAENQKNNLHTLFLLDLDPGKEQFMAVNDAIDILLRIEKRKKKKLFTGKTHCIGVARLGGADFVIKAGTAQELRAKDFGKPPHCLIVPAKKLHFMEEEMLEFWKEKEAEEKV